MMRMIVVVLLMLVGTVHAELKKLTEADFGTNASKFRSNLIEGANPASAWSRWGILLSSDPTGAPVIRAWRPPCDSCASPYYPVITNMAKGKQAETALVVDFLSPVKKAGIFAIGANPPVEVSIKVFDRSGNRIGTIKDTVGEVGEFIGFEPAAPIGGFEPNYQKLIAKVVIDYASAEIPEQIMDLAFEPASPPQFETVLPQVAHGQLGSDLLLRTKISIVNISNTTAKGEVRFYSPEGKALAPKLEGSAPDDAGQFSLDPAEMQLITTGGSMAGYARIASSAPVQAIAHFTVIKGGGEWTETAVASVEGRFRAVGGYDNEVPASAVLTSAPPQNLPKSATKVGTGLAVVNLAEDTAFVRLRQLGETGPSEDRVFLLAPGEQFARFIDETFDAQSTRGTIRIWSTRPVAAVLIKTVNGLPVSILPLASLED